MMTFPHHCTANKANFRVRVNVTSNSFGIRHRMDRGKHRSCQNENQQAGLDGFVPLFRCRSLCVHEDLPLSILPVISVFEVTGTLTKAPTISKMHRDGITSQRKTIELCLVACSCLAIQGIRTHHTKSSSTCAIDSRNYNNR